MGIYDNLVIFPDIEVDDFPLDISRDIDGSYRWWQTKQLNPSMDMYAILPSSKIGSGKLMNSSDNKFYLCRRHPPVTKWTNSNEGSLLGEDEDVIEDADHWRNVRYTGEIGLTSIGRDSRHYDIKLEIENGIFDSITVESHTAPIDRIFPVPDYDDLLDFSSDPPKIIGTDISIEDLSESVYEHNNFHSVVENTELSEKQIARCLNYYNTEYTDN